MDLEDFDPSQLAKCDLAVFLMATYGEGEHTDNATNFNNWMKNESEEDRTSESTGNTGTLKNSMNSVLKTNSTKQSLYAGLLFKHKFKKARRTLSLNADWNKLTTEGT